MMLKNCLLTTTALAAALFVAVPAHADGGGSLADRVRKLEMELEKSKEYQQNMRTRLTTLEANADAVQWSFDNGRPTIKSGDGRFQLSFRGRFHFDFAHFDQDTNETPLNSGVNFRRVQFGVEGKVFRDFWYEMRFNFGDSGNEAPNNNVNIMRLAYHGIKNFRLNVGVIQPIFTMSDSVSSNEITFIERAQVVNILTDNFGGSDGRHGVEATFQKKDMFYSGDNVVLTAAYTGRRNATANLTNDEQQQVLGRAAYRLWSDGVSNIQVGGSGAYILDLENRGLTFGDRPEMRVDGTTLISASVGDATGGNAYGFEAGANWKSFYVGGEYYRFAATDRTSGAEDANFSGWYVETSYFLTGESKAYAASSMSNNPGVFGAPKVVKPFSPAAGSWGAWELAARYSSLDLTDGAAGFGKGAGATGTGAGAGVQRDISVGLNWYLNNNVRTMFNYINADIDSGSANRTQQVNIFGARLQFAF